MKFKQGNKVEVLRKQKKEFESCWYPGKIIYIVGSQYTVSYNLVRNSKGEPLVENVCRGDVRPIPPPTKRDGEWVIGDVVEVFDLSCWKAGKIAKVMNGNRVVIRLVGSIQLKEFHESNLRVRQTWQNGEWVAAVKGGRERRDDNNDTLRKCSSLTQGLGRGSQQHLILKEPSVRDGEEQEKFKNLQLMKKSKRNIDLHFESAFHDEITEIGGRKRKALMKVGHSGRLPKKAKMGKNCNYSLHPFSMPVMVVTEDSNECSVASCSSNYLPDYKPRSWEISSKNGDGSCFDDAGSVCPSMSEKDYLQSYADDELPDDEDNGVHKLELHAYKSTVQALYVSGPLSWEQESLLTNLRLSLNISNEEHLRQLRQLLSAQVL
ncbi:uncharacterized protein LOC113315110 [Papaver somniferum]|uniref:uncharacterized protein LOC113315110 n=1 Tax=Papaver somniferum TaxID=3469 RepID=UPI000E705CBC|nr:uncharacterized protein LOC113315110 [Papaver somniferum]XP_026419212.1 uncharacterized protein LOC113315110 [Papaver somniferum]XP_026419213.1 uncharacterized protein LOC113315110 [Papaver somniferum]